LTANFGRSQNVYTVVKYAFPEVKALDISYSFIVSMPPYNSSYVSHPVALKDGQVLAKFYRAEGGDSSVITCNQPLGLNA
jgi:hypothetical protein